MRFLKVQNELITDNNITSNEFRVYVYLLSLYNEKEKCAYPAIETIAGNINISEATVKRSIKKLVELGYMIIAKKKGNSGNYNTYRELKYLTKNITETTKKVIRKTVSIFNEKQPKIVSDYKEKGMQMEIDDITPFSVDHQQKISLILKQKIKLTEKQMWLIGDMDLEILRKSIFRFKKLTKTNSFTFLIECYYTECSIDGNVEPSNDLQRYTGNKFIPLCKEREEVKSVMKEDGLLSEGQWNEYIEEGF